MPDAGWLQPSKLPLTNFQDGKRSGKCLAVKLGTHVHLAAVVRCTLCQTLIETGFRLQDEEHGPTKAEGSGGCVLPGMGFQHVGYDLGQLDEAPFEHDSKLGAWGVSSWLSC